MQLKQIIKAIIPPVILNGYLKYSGRNCVWSGDYKTWKDAQTASTGYDSDQIINKVKDSTLLVLNGNACFERDSVLFYKEEYNFGLLSSLLYISSKNKGGIKVIDFGGALGSTYYQHRQFLDEFIISWNIVEQKKFVDEGKKLNFSKKVHFFYDLMECKKKTSANVLVLSSVLQYLQDPYGFIKSIKKMGFDYILIDRTAFVNSSDRLTVQTVPKRIYPAKYPCWFFNEEKFVNLFKSEYSSFAEFDSLDSANIKSKFKGFLFKRKGL